MADDTEVVPPGAIAPIGLVGGVGGLEAGFCKGGHVGPVEYEQSSTGERRVFLPELSLQSGYWVGWVGWGLDFVMADDTEVVPPGGFRAVFLSVFIRVHRWLVF